MKEKYSCSCGSKQFIRLIFQEVNERGEAPPLQKCSIGNCLRELW
jgi:hypothetical protein